MTLRLEKPEALRRTRTPRGGRDHAHARAAFAPKRVATPHSGELRRDPRIGRSSAIASANVGPGKTLTQSDDERAAPGVAGLRSPARIENTELVRLARRARPRSRRGSPISRNPGSEKCITLLLRNDTHVGPEARQLTAQHHAIFLIAPRISSVFRVKKACSERSNWDNRMGQGRLARKLEVCRARGSSDVTRESTQSRDHR